MFPVSHFCFPDIIDWMAIYTGYIWGTWCILYPYTCWRYFHHFPWDFHTTQAIKQGESSHFTMMFPSFSNSIVKIWLLVSSFILSIVGILPWFYLRIPGCGSWLFSIVFSGIHYTIPITHHLVDQGCLIISILFWYETALSPISWEKNTHGPIRSNPFWKKHRWFTRFTRSDPFS